MTHPEPPLRLPFRINDLLSGAHAVISITVVLIGLIAWSVRQESRISHLEANFDAQKHRLDDFDVHGTRAVIVLTEHLNAIDQREKEASSVMAGRIQVINEKLNQVDNLLRRLDVVLTRQDEGQRRIEALERTLNILQHNHNLRYHLSPGPGSGLPR